MEFRQKDSNDVKTIHLSSSETSYVISDGILPNTYYDIVFKCSYVDPETGEDIVDTIDSKTVITKLPSLSIKVPSTSFGKITYQITTDNSYALTSGTLTIYIKDKTEGIFKKHSSYNIDINGNTVGNIEISDILNEDIVELRLTDVMSEDIVISDLQASCMFKY